MDGETARGIAGLTGTTFLPRKRRVRRESRDGFSPRSRWSQRL